MDSPDLPRWVLYGEPRMLTTPRATAFRATLASLAIATVVAPMASLPAGAQTARRDGIADLLKRNGETPIEDKSPGVDTDGKPLPAPADPRAGDLHYEQARRLMAAVDAVLKDTAEQRSQSKKLPGKDEFILTPIWTETREDRERKINNLLDAALGIVTDVPIVELQKKIETLRRNIRELEDQIVDLKEKQLIAPKEAMLPGVLNDTVDSLAAKVKEHEDRIGKNREEIAATKAEVTVALQKAGVELAPDQVDLLLDSVLSGDLIRLVATFNAAKLIDGQLAKMMQASGDNINASRKYFAMHAALFAMLVHAQDSSIEKIDTGYMPKLEAILKDITAAKAKTNDLMRAENRPDQKSALEANRDSQKLAEDAAKGYRRYLQQQREQIAKARSRATHDLRIADNTFETVEASFQLRNLMRDSYTSFEAIQKLEAPTFDQIFKNEELRREFENLTRKLDAPSS
jgi:polyhydroxyalkanoate synthesis regulator phasin